MSKQPSDIDRPMFEPIDPWKSEELTFKRRNLPHVEVPGATYFVTFRCKSTAQLSPEARDLVMDAIQACAGLSIDLDAAVIMSDHAHAIFRLIGTHRLSQILKQIKGRSARRINQLQKTEGSLWMDETFDHIVRDGTDLEGKIEYIRQNPVKIGLVSRSADYQWLFVKR